jgi:hypothetical protein
VEVDNQEERARITREPTLKVAPSLNGSQCPSKASDPDSHALILRGDKWESTALSGGCQAITPISCILDSNW